MNIMLFSRFVARSGVGQHMKTLSEELTRQGHHVTVVAAFNDLGFDKDGSNVTFLELPFKNSRNLPTFHPVGLIRNLLWLRRVIRERKIEIAHCHHRTAALYMKLYRLFFRVPVAYTLHLAGVPSDFLHRSLTFMGEEAIGVSSEVSRFMVEKLRLPKERVTTVFNGIDTRTIYPLESSEKKRVCNKFAIGGGV